MNYLAPSQLDDALDALNGAPFSIIAGGTDWYPAQGEAPVQCDMLDITRIAELRGFERSDGGWRIGAACTWSDVIKADVPAAFDGLKSAAREVGSVQIQNAGTVVGNLCNASPAADGVPPLLTLDAQVEIRSCKARRLLPLAEFITGPRQTELQSGEMVTGVIIPELSSEDKSAFIKLGARKYLVISIAMIAVRLQMQGDILSKPKIAVGACSAVAQRMTKLESALEGTSVGDLEQTIAQSDLSSLRPIDDVRGSGAYRLDVAASLIARAIKEAAHG